MTLTVIVSGMVRADEPAVWELKPYHIQVLLTPDWSSQWKPEDLQQLRRDVLRRSRAEVGPSWQLEVEVASREVRYAVLGHGDAADFGEIQPLLDGFRDRDKAVVVALRVGEQGRSAEAWELDWASERWQGSRCWPAFNRTGIQQAVFEAIDSVVSPLGLVKLASGQRVVLRQRASLLPERNHRRTKVTLNSVFEVLRSDSRETASSAGDRPLLVVEQINEQGVACRILTPDGNPLEGTSLDSWIAVLVHQNHDATEYHLTMAENDVPAPLSSCEAWVSDRRAEPGRLIGCPDAQGVLVLPANGKVQWLRIRVGPVVLREHCVFPGMARQQFVHTRLTPTRLLHASLLAVSTDEVAQLLVLRNLYLTRHQYRLDAGRDDAAAALLNEMKELLGKRSAQLLEVVRQRRSEVAQRDVSESRRFESQWSALIGTLMIDD